MLRNLFRGVFRFSVYYKAEGVKIDLENNMKIKNWFKKNTFYKVLIIAVVLAIAGYMLWFFQKMPLIPDGAENIRIDKTYYSNDSITEPIAVQIIYDHYSGDQYVTHLIDLTEEGSEKLIEALKGQKIQAVWSEGADHAWRAEGRFSFAVKYELDGVEYSPWFYSWSDIQVFRNWRPLEEGAKPKFSPASNYNTKIAGEAETDSLYETIIDIIKNYAASDRIAN